MTAIPCPIGTLSPPRRAPRSKLAEFSGFHETRIEIRGGIIEHLASGKLSLFDLGVYVVVHLQADFSAGIWKGSAPRIIATAPAGTSLRAIQRSIERLTKIGFLRPFRSRGLRGNYPVLIDKYEVRMGAQKGKRLNAWKSATWRTPVYESCAHLGALSIESLRPGFGFERERSSGVASNVEHPEKPSVPAAPKKQIPQHDKFGTPLAIQGGSYD